MAAAAPDLLAVSSGFFGRPRPNEGGWGVAAVAEPNAGKASVAAGLGVSLFVSEAAGGAAGEVGLGAKRLNAGAGVPVISLCQYLIRWRDTIQRTRSSWRRVHFPSLWEAEGAPWGCRSCTCVRR